MVQYGVVMVFFTDCDKHHKKCNTYIVALTLFNIFTIFILQRRHYIGVLYIVI